jgi:hypothetical protein
MVYKPFSNKEKLVNTWNQVADNEALIKNFIQQFDIEVQKNFDSVHYYKGGVEVQLGQITSISTSTIVQFLIKDFPEDLINFSEPRILISVPSGYDIRNAIESPTASFAAGTLKRNDIFIGTTNRTTWWWTQLGERDWHLNIGLSQSISFCSSVSYPGGFSFAAIPNKTYDISLCIYNGREFPEVQSGK